MMASWITALFLKIYVVFKIFDSQLFQKFCHSKITMYMVFPKHLWTQFTKNLF